MSSGYITGAKQAQTLGSNKARKVRKVKQKLSWRQRLRNWLNKDIGDSPVAQDIRVEEANLSSEGMRFHLYRAAGGFVVETRQYDHKNDRSYNKLYIVRDDQDVGEELGKIITIESLR